MPTTSALPVSRRTLLRGLGVSLALPLLDCMRPLRAAAQIFARSTPVISCASLQAMFGPRSERVQMVVGRSRRPLLAAWA